VLSFAATGFSDTAIERRVIMNSANDVLRLHQRDNVLVALTELAEGKRVSDITCMQVIPAGHKVAAMDIADGQPVIKFGQMIGLASRPIKAGEHVHVHNCVFTSAKQDVRAGESYQKTVLLPEAEQATFQGIVRADGRVATRNMIAVMTTVNCSATVAKAIVDRMRQQVLRDYPNIDDIVAFTHPGGCGTSAKGDNIELLRRTLGGYMHHPNVAGVLLLGLGCEVNQGSLLLDHAHLQQGPLLQYLNIQDAGGSRAAMEKGIELLTPMLPIANDIRRQTVSAKHITVGLQCGGSDGYSGITANPALGAAADLVVRNGGTAILSETPEIYGAEPLLIRRAASQEIADKLMSRIQWWEKYVASSGGSMDNNPSPGNKQGGLTTILEKSLGAVAKAGTTGLMGVYEYAQQIDKHGFVFMDSPGNDPYSATGQVASGANVICFTTGRGSVYGCKPAPSLKLTTTSELYKRMSEDMDIDCGVVLSGKVSVEQLGEKIFREILEVASGKRTKSEEFGFGDNEFLPWSVGAVM
jgi:altronate hydrolase